MKPKTSAAILILIAFAILAALYFSGCSAASREKLKTAWKSALPTLEAQALRTLGSIATAELHTLAIGSGDYAHSAATAAWTSIDAGSLVKAIRDAGGSTPLAVRASDIAQAAIDSGGDERKVLNAVAAAISTGASK